MILDEIAAAAVRRVEKRKQEVPLSQIREMAQKLAKETVSPEKLPFESALRTGDISFICEVKKASPSKGLIAPHFPYVEIAREYEAAGASAISVLTEPYYFQGSNAYLTEIRRAVSIPILRKDFIVDEYMIYEAKAIGADAILLICSLLSQAQLAEYEAVAAGLGLDVLTEVHDEAEVEMARKAGARIVGVNNRNLKDFTVDINNSLRLRALVPADVLFVSESGMKSREDIAALRENGTDAVLIGETLMRSKNKKEMLDTLAGRNGEAG